MAKRPADPQSSPVAGLGVGTRTSGKAAAPHAGGGGHDDGPGPVLQAGWKLFGPMSRAQTIVVLAIGAWIVLALVVLGIFSLFAGD